MDMDEFLGWLNTFVLLLFVSIVGALFFSGCAQNQFKMDPSVRYKLDTRLVVRTADTKKNIRQIVDGGMGTVNVEPPYNLLFETKGAFDLIYINTCGRSDEAENEGQKQAIIYNPDEDIEIGGDCPLTVSGYDKDKNKHTFGYFDFKYHYPEMNMEGVLTCNGGKEKNTILTCQTKSQVMVQVEFPELTIISVEKGPSSVAQELVDGAATCEANNYDGTEISNNTIIRSLYRFPVPSGLCTYYFMGKSGRKSKLTTYGYDEYPVRAF